MTNLKDTIAYLRHYKISIKIINYTLLALLNMTYDNYF